MRLPVGPSAIEGDLELPRGARGIVCFAHGSGSSRYSPRNRQVAKLLQDGGFGTLLFDLLTPEEDARDLRTGEFRFDIPRLAERLVAVTDQLVAEPATRGLAIGYFGASTGAAAALVAAAERPLVAAVVSRGGRPDLAGAALTRVVVPTLLIVGERDPTVLELNRAALQRLEGPTRLEIVPGATHLFEEPGALDAVATLAGEFFAQYL